MNNKVLIVLVVIVIAGLGYLALRPKAPAPVPEQTTIRGTVVDSVDPQNNLSTITLQNYDDLENWTADVAMVRDLAGALKHGDTVTIVGTKAAEKTINAQSITQTSLPGIALTKPAKGDTVAFPMIVEGVGRAFENSIVIRVKNADGSVLASQSTMVDAPDVGLFGRFHAEISYPTPKSATGTVEVSEPSAKDGTALNLLAVPIQFPSIETTQVKVYFSNRIQDPDAAHCDAVYPVTRTVAKTAALAQAALGELLKNPSPSESAAGFFSNIPDGTKINSVNIANGTATADFSAELDPHGGSCRVAAIRAEITKTLMQFPTVKKVLISINGKSEGILQP